MDPEAGVVSGSETSGCQKPEAKVRGGRQASVRLSGDRPGPDTALRNDSGWRCEEGALWAVSTQVKGGGVEAGLGEDSESDRDPVGRDRLLNVPLLLACPSWRAQPVHLPVLHPDGPQLWSRAEA